MSVLQPKIDDGTLVVKSGQTDIEQAATLRWSQETAQKRMEDLLTGSYSDGTKVNGVLSPYDGICPRHHHRAAERRLRHRRGRTRCRSSPVRTPRSPRSS